MLAVVAQSLESFRVPSFPDPHIKIPTDFRPMFSAASVDVVERQEIMAVLSATYAHTPIVGEDLPTELFIPLLRSCLVPGISGRSILPAPIASITALVAFPEPVTLAASEARDRAFAFTLFADPDSVRRTAVLLTRYTLPGVVCLPTLAGELLERRQGFEEAACSRTSLSICCHFIQ